MSVAVLISTLIETSARATQIETCEVVLSKLRKSQIEKTLPKQTLLVDWDKEREDGGQKLNFLGLSKKRGRGV